MPKLFKGKEREFWGHNWDAMDKTLDVLCTI